MPEPQDLDPRRRRLVFRALHRGTKEADLMIGGFADRWLDEMSEAEIQWFEVLMDEQDVDIMAWAFGRGEPPERLQGPLFERLKALDYIKLVPR